jgi:hypothetical protein
MTPKPSPAELTAGGAHARPRPVRAGVRRRLAGRAELDVLLARYPTKMAALLPALWIVQRARGHVSAGGDGRGGRGARPHAGVREGRGHVLHDVPPAPGGAALHPGVHHHAVQRVRRRGRGERVPRAHRLPELGVTSADGRYTVIEVECLGACGFATPVQINDEYVESVTPERVPAILAALP